MRYGKRSQNITATRNSLFFLAFLNLCIYLESVDIRSVKCLFKKKKSLKRKHKIQAHSLAEWKLTTIMNSPVVHIFCTHPTKCTDTVHVCKEDLNVLNVSFELNDLQSLNALKHFMD